MKRTLSGLILLLLACGSVHAALLSRAGGQAYYDDVLNITWLTNANLAASNTFGVTGILPEGYMNWNNAQSWIGAMNAANYLGTSTWRLPTIIDTGTAGCNGAFTGTDCGYNVDLGTGEMAHMFYSTLGNVGYYNTSGSPTGCADAPNYCLTNSGPFSNLQSSVYWSGTTYAPNTSNAWNFVFYYGSQLYDVKRSGSYVWAVSPGDALVPVPGALWLFGSALGLMGLLRRKVLTGTA
jgi:hypothetical protein